MKITVTQDHINKGYRFNTDRCPIALAVREKFPNATVSVTNQDIHVKKWFLRRYNLPKEAIHFVYDFDNRLSVQPIEFEAKRKFFT